MQDPFAPAVDAAPVRRVPLARPFHWLRLGWRDYTRTLVAGSLHGLLVFAGAWVILAITLRYWYLLPGAFSGFLLVGPMLATGLYELSRRLERGERPRMADALSAWRRGTRPLVWLGLILVLAIAFIELLLRGCQRKRKLVSEKECVELDAKTARPSGRS